MPLIRNIIDGLVIVILASVEIIGDWLHGRRSDDNLRLINEMNWRWRVPPPEPEPVELPEPWDDPRFEVGGEA